MVMGVSYCQLFHDRLHSSFYTLHQVELVDPIERFTDRDWVEQVSEGYLDSFRHRCRCLLFANQGADAPVAFKQCLNYFGPDLACPTCNENPHGKTPSSLVSKRLPISPAI